MLYEDSWDSVTTSCKEVAVHIKIHREPINDIVIVEITEDQIQPAF